jgi:glutaminyl-peptide cyclotransferase
MTRFVLGALVVLATLPFTAALAQRADEPQVIPRLLADTAPEQGAASGLARCPSPERVAFEVTGRIGRDHVGFTQGLEFESGRILESTGAHGGGTNLNVIDQSGQVTSLVNYGTKLFGEGLTILSGEIFQLTWMDHRVFVYDLSGHLLREMNNPYFGWGLTNDGHSLIFTDGTSTLFYASSVDFRITASVPIRIRDIPLEHVNELEFLNGRILGNVFGTDVIVRLDPKTGCVDGFLDLSFLRGLMSEEERAAISRDPNYVLNGIAYDSARELLFLTGKNWPMIFVGRLRTP